MHFQSPRPKNDEERILPLINVVFLLLVFFMLAGHLAATGPFQVAPPQSSSGGSPGEGDLIVLLGADGRVAVDGTEIAPSALVDVVSRRLAAQEKVRVQLKGDARVDAARALAIMELLREAGVEQLRLLTVPGS